MTSDDIISYVNSLELDLKIRGGNPRYFDQKVQPDVVEIISQCILEFSKKKHFFTINEIWNNKFSENLIAGSRLQLFGRKLTNTNLNAFNPFNPPRFFKDFAS